MATDRQDPLSQHQFGDMDANQNLSLEDDAPEIVLRSLYAEGEEAHGAKRVRFLQKQWRGLTGFFSRLRNRLRTRRESDGHSAQEDIGPGRSHVSDEQGPLFSGEDVETIPEMIVEDSQELAADEINDALLSAPFSETVDLSAEAAADQEVAISTEGYSPPEEEILPQEQAKEYYSEQDILFPSDGEGAAEESMPDWLSKLQSYPQMEKDIPEEERIQDRLSTLGSQTPAGDEIAELELIQEQIEVPESSSPSDEEVIEPAEVPDWLASMAGAVLSDEKGDEQEEPEDIFTISESSLHLEEPVSKQEEIPDWLSSSGTQVQPGEEVVDKERIPEGQVPIEPEITPVEDDETTREYVAPFILGDDWGLDPERQEFPNEIFKSSEISKAGQISLSPEAEEEDVLAEIGQESIFEMEQGEVEADITREHIPPMEDLKISLADEEPEDILVEEEIQIPFIEVEEQLPEIEEGEVSPTDLDTVADLRSEYIEEFALSIEEEIVSQEGEVDAAIDQLEIATKFPIPDILKEKLKPFKERFSKLSKVQKVLLFSVPAVGIILFTVVMASLGVFGKPSEATPIAQADAGVVDMSIYPFRLELPGGWDFHLKKGELIDGKWEPESAEWLSGTELRRVVAIPWSKQAQAVIGTLESGDEVKLIMSNFDVIDYRVKEVLNIPRAQAELLMDTQPSLIVILFQPEEDYRWVVICEQ